MILLLLCANLRQKGGRRSHHRPDARLGPLEPAMHSAKYPGRPASPKQAEPRLMTGSVFCGRILFCSSSFAGYCREVRKVKRPPIPDVPIVKCKTLEFALFNAKYVPVPLVLYWQFGKSSMSLPACILGPHVAATSTIHSCQSTARAPVILRLPFPLNPCTTTVPPNPSSVLAIRIPVAAKQHSFGSLRGSRHGTSP